MNNNNEPVRKPLLRPEQGKTKSDKQEDYWSTEEFRQFQGTYELRKQSADKLFNLIRCWLIIVTVFLFLAGFEITSFSLKEISFNISDNVLIALITSTTASVLGLYVIVAKWLFPNNDKDA